jgi:hypothetical protein
VKFLNQKKLKLQINMASETFEVSLHGGSPWGFRLQGGKEFRAPLLIAKVSWSTIVFENVTASHLV